VFVVVFVAGDSPLPLDAAIVIFDSATAGDADSYCNAMPTNGMGQNGFIALDFDAEEGGSSSRQDSIVNDRTQKEILRPDAPTTTVGQKCGMFHFHRCHCCVRCRRH
jgi:hypothetical protein